MEWNKNDQKLFTVAWFSAGVSSAVAIKLVIDQVDLIMYTHIEDQHPDGMRFVKDCEEWFGKEIVITQSPFKSVESACMMHGKGYINGPAGANCTRWLKKKVREEWERENEDKHLRYIWGFDNTEGHRHARQVEVTMPAFEHVSPLIDRNYSKSAVHKILKASGIKRPAMYDLGYNNNNCVGCVKGGMGYWNHIRVDFPEVFQARAKMERKVGHSCINGTFLDELNPDVGRHTPPVVNDCGIFCEMMGL